VDASGQREVIGLDVGLLIEQNDEWLVSRRYLSEASMAELTITQPTPTTGPDSHRQATTSLRTLGHLHEVTSSSAGRTNGQG
jgi:hypothetical protein